MAAHKSRILALVMYSFLPGTLSGLNLMANDAHRTAGFSRCRSGSYGGQAHAMFAPTSPCNAVEPSPSKKSFYNFENTGVAQVVF
jgi:hypothetical protein